MTYWRVLILTILCIVDIPAVIAQAKPVRLQPKITYTVIDYPGAFSTTVHGTNSVGDVVGHFVPQSLTTDCGFVMSNGQFTLVDYPGAADTIAYGINDSGQIVGAYFQQVGRGDKGFLYDGQNFTSIAVPSREFTEAHGINNAGEIVGDTGWSTGSSARSEGFELSGGQFTFIRFPGHYPGQNAGGINNLGEIVGVRASSTVGDIFVYRGGQFHFIDLGPDSGASGVNDSGIIVGSYVNKGVYDGFALWNGKYITFAYPGAYATLATGISNLGVVVGYYLETAAGPAHGFATSPIALEDFK